MQHRGPDDEGFFVDKNVALGHRALKIADSQIPREPLANEDETIWITCDGEIYNKDQLIRQLQKNHMLRAESSAEVIVHFYEDYGFNCLHEFNGIFAFCLWDSKNGWIFSARDRLGIKPLYYCRDKDRFILASEIKGILADRSVPRIPNEHAIYDFLITGFQHHGGDTFFNGIKELPPAHYMIADQKGISLEGYWNLASIKLDQSRRDEHYTSRFRELLRDSIKIRLPTNLPVGSFLSGGLDSTSVACLIDDIAKSICLSTNARGEPQRLFSFFDDKPTTNESSFVEEVSHSIKAEINNVFPPAAGLWDDIKNFVYYMDEPVTVLNYYVYWCLARAVKEQVQIVFSGQGPDEFLAGHDDHFVTYLRELWNRKAIVRLLTELVDSLGRYGLNSIMKYAFTIFTPSEKPQVKRLLNPQFVAANNSGQAQRESNSLRRTLLQDVTTKRLPIHLRVGDRVASAFSIECRNPYLDHRIVEFAFSLPETLMIRNGWTKYVLRSAMKGIIPEAIRKRRKLGTPIPLETWMQHLSGHIRKVFSSKKFQERGCFSQTAILDIYDRYCDRRLSRMNRRLYAEALWRILNVELWLEIFFDQKQG